MKTMTMPVAATLDFARRLFTRGTDVFGAEEVKQVFDKKLESTPAIPFTEEELTRARKLGQFLILHVPMTMKQLHSQFDNKLGEGKLLYDIDWYQKESFFTTEKTNLEWKLVSREVIPGSAGKNYLGQTEVIVDYVRNQVFKGLEMPFVYQTAIEEFESHKDKLETLLGKDWKKAAEELADLKINQLFRNTPVETLYDIAVYFKVNREYLLPGVYDWTSARSSDGGLVSIGLSDAVGVGVDGGGPDCSGSRIGLRFSRSVAPNLES